MCIQKIAQNKDRYAMVTFYVEGRKRQCSADTNDTCKDRINLVLDDLVQNYQVKIEDDKIVGLTGPVVQRWYNKFIDARKPSTINHYFSFVRPFLEWAYSIGYLDNDVSRLVKSVRLTRTDEVPEWERPKDKYLNHDEARMLLDHKACDRYAARNRAIIALFLYSGIRVSELCSLTVGAVTRSPEGLIYCKRKGGRWSYVEVADAFYDYLADYFEQSGRSFDDVDEPLFMTQNRTPMDRRLIYMIIAPIQKKLGIATGSHALRHTYISEIDKLGGPTIARDLANHSSIKITNRYDHTTREQRLEVLNKLEW